MRIYKNHILISILSFLLFITVNVYGFDWVIVKYHLGDWYNARDAVGNFLEELEERTAIDVDDEIEELEMDDERIFEHYFLFINGHVPITMNETEKDYFRKFVLNGGFVLVNDDYGLDESFRELIEEVFPEYTFAQIPFDHEIYHCFYEFDEGLPKIHEHDGEPAEGWGLFVDDRIGIYYVYSSDIVDGWDYPSVHDDPEDLRELAFQMGVNIVVYSLSY